MSAHSPSVRIAVCGSETPGREVARAWGLWPVGYPAALGAAGAEAVLLNKPSCREHWSDLLEGVHGLVLAGSEGSAARQPADDAALLHWCRERRFPLLAIDQGMLTLNATFGGSSFLDLARELPEALQHRHPPEHGVRHAITVSPGSRLAQLYGEGEIVVNSEHRRAVCRLARGFVISARALDGVIEAVEAENEEWFALGVQWQPASATASGLDIQLFRGLVEAAARRAPRATARSRSARPRARARQLVSA
jgi:putative glutamine amidotransferase